MNAYAKYSGLAIQMGVIICLGVFGGQYVDRFFELKDPWGTIVLSLLGVFTSLYIVIKEVIKLNK
jgi:F0F1-type ATP synthase assembly protein I